MIFSDSKWAELCKNTQGLVPAKIGDDAWILITAATVAASPSTEPLDEFYGYLTKHEPAFATDASRNQLSVRFRDILLKLITLVGAPQVLCVVMSLAAAEGHAAARSEKSSLNDKWKPGNLDVEALCKRGENTMKVIYGPYLLPKIFNTWGSHKEDVNLDETFAVYGLYLSDFEILTPLEAEAVVYATISCLGLGGPGNWHLRGMGRMLGARGSDGDSAEEREVKCQLNNLREAVMSVVRFVGDEFAERARLEKWATVESMLDQFGGWGEDAWTRNDLPQKISLN